MIALKLDTLDALGSVLTSNAPVASTSDPGSPDFANMVAVAEQIVPTFPQRRDVYLEHQPSLTVEEPDTNGVDVSETVPTTIKTQFDAPTPQMVIVVPASPTVAQSEDTAELPNEESVAFVALWTRAPKASIPHDKPVLKFAEATTTPVVVSVAPPVPEGRQPIMLQPEPLVPQLADYRTTATITAPVIDRVLPTLVERMIAFTPAIIDAARDLAQIGEGRDVRFNVRPETLGPVAVTIERTDAGQSLRLAVESPVAVQAVRQAEPIFNDQRGGSPFINVTVDLTASDQRGRTPRTVSTLQRDHVANPDNQSTEPALTGRYA